MTKWSSKSQARRTWAHATKFFEKRTAEMDKFELTNGTANKPNEFAGAATELANQLARAMEIIAEKDKEHALALKEAKLESQTLQSQVTTLAKMID